MSSSSTGCVNETCACASTNPGMSVAPAPSITCASPASIVAGDGRRARCECRRRGPRRNVPHRCRRIPGRRGRERGPSPLLRTAVNVLISTSPDARRGVRRGGYSRLGDEPRCGIDADRSRALPSGRRAAVASYVHIEHAVLFRDNMVDRIHRVVGDRRVEVGPQRSAARSFEARTNGAVCRRCVIVE